MTVSVSAPGKLVLFGDHAAVYGHPCIVTAVDLRYTVHIEASDSPGIHIDTADLRASGIRYHVTAGQLSAHNRRETAFVEAALKRLLAEYPCLTGLQIRTDGPAQSYGLGSSSAITAATIAAYAALLDLKLTPRQIFDLAYAAVLDVQGTGSGVDLAAAIYGGTVYYVKGGSVLDSLALDSLPIVIGYSGAKVSTINLLAQVADLRARHPHMIDTLLGLMAEISTEARGLLETDAWDRTGELMNLNQGLLDALGVSTLNLNRLIVAAREAGAYGAKLSGAGGGDCMFALCAPERRAQVAEGIAQASGQVIDLPVHATGLRRESPST